MILAYNDILTTHGGLPKGGTGDTSVRLRGGMAGSGLRVISFGMGGSLISTLAGGVVLAYGGASQRGMGESKAICSGLSWAMRTEFNSLWKAGTRHDDIQKA